MDSTPPRQAFAFYRVAASPIVGIQLSDIESGAPVPANSLECYRVKSTIETPWFRLALLTGSRLLLTPATGASLLAAGKIERLMSETLVLHRKGFEAPETTGWVSNQKTTSRERITKAGKPDRSGSQAEARKAKPAASPRKR